MNTPTLLYQTNYPMLVGADTLQQAGITGRGVTIAVLDSGLWQAPSQNYGTRMLATIDVTNGGSGPVTGDPYGHGTHVTSIAAGGAMNISGSYLGIAPQANLVDRARLRRRGRRPLRRRDRRPQLDRRQPREIQHSRGEPVLRRDARVVLLERSARPGRHGGMAGGHRRGGGRRQRRPEPDDRRCARQRALRDHGRRAHRQLHAL